MGVAVGSNGLLIVGSLEFGAEAAGATANIYLAINAGNHYSADKAKLEGAGNSGGTTSKYIPKTERWEPIGQTKGEWLKQNGYTEQ